MPSANEPDFTGKRVSEYAQRLKVSIKWGVKKKPPKSASAKFDTPQLKFVYELFGRCNTASIVGDRQFNKDFVSKHKDHMTTKLKLSSVETRSKNSKPEPSEQLLSTLRQCIIDDPKVITNGASEEDVSNPEEEAATMDDDELDAQDEDACRNHDKIEVDSMNVDLEILSKIKKAGYNVQCVTDIWSIGKEMIVGDKIKEKRVSAKRRFGRKLDMMREIGKLIDSAKSISSVCEYSIGRVRVRLREFDYSGCAL
jgi:hypothetical protein